MRSRLVLLGLGLLLVVFNALVARKERVVAHGTRLLLPLAPVDPRSLLQGDYMALRYKLPDADGWPRDGRLVIERDQDEVGHFVRLDDPSTPLAPGELVLRYRKRGEYEPRLGAEAFYFQEGTAWTYNTAGFGELRVASSGESVLVGLCDRERHPLGGIRLGQIP